MLKAQTAYMESLESIDPVAMHQKQLDDEKTNAKKGKKDNATHGALDTPAAAAMKATFTKLMELHTKLNADITPAKREPAIGKLSSKDITLMWKQLRMIFIPVLGLSTSIDVLRRHAEKQRWTDLDLNAEEDELRQEQFETLHMMMKTMKGD
jgi:type II secretory pathway component PulF